MAVRDRNLFAWQAYVITMAFVSVGLLLGMFFLWRSYSDLSAKFEDQKTQSESDRQQFTLSERRVDRLLSMMGIGEYGPQELEQMAADFAGDEKLGEAERLFAEQMKLFAANESDTDKNLGKLPEYLLQTIRMRNKEVADARNRENGLKKAMSDLRQEQADKLKQAVDAQVRAETELDEARKNHTAEIAKMNSEKNEAVANFERTLQIERDKNSQLTAANGQQQNKINELNETIAQQQEIIKSFQDPDFASPQATIKQVAKGGTMIWIDIGRDDGLRVGVPFSVIDSDTIKFADARPKAHAVVTRIIDGHMAVAEVTDYDFRRTIVPGDKVYSPAWRPGRPVGFALVGMMDINDDGRDDADQVRELIRLAGGQIDAQIDSRGNRNDALSGMSPSTSYIVLGTDLTLNTVSQNVEGSEALQEERQRKAEMYKDFLSEAKSKGLMEINLDKLMGFLKVEASDRTIPLGQNVRGDDFRARRETSTPSSLGSVSDLFQKRTPN